MVFLTSALRLVSSRYTQVRLASFTLSFVVLCIAAHVVPAQTTILFDSFESGDLSVDWDVVALPQSQVENEGGGAEGSIYYARLSGDGDRTSELGVSLAPDKGSVYVKDFRIALDFRVQSTSTSMGQFSITVSSSSSLPNIHAASLNLRYQDGIWSAYNGNWTPIISLGEVVAGQWNQFMLSGRGWGSGPEKAVYDIQLTDHLGKKSIAQDLRVYQSGDLSPDLDGAKSLSISNAFGDNPSVDLDNVFVTVGNPKGPASKVLTPSNPIAYSGIYPSLAVTNTHKEVGIGGIVKRDDKIYFVTYGPHIVTGGSDKLYSVDLTDMSRTTFRAYPGNTDANRYTDSQLGIDIVGAAYIDAKDKVRFLPVTHPGDLRGRVTGTAAHLTNPNKLYYMTMEEGLFEVDFSDLNNPIISVLREDGNVDSTRDIQKNLPGVHGKGLYTAQNCLFYTNNGAGNGAKGGLVEWDGSRDPEQLASWKIVDSSAQYTEVTSRKGPRDMDPASTETGLGDWLGRCFVVH